VPERLFLQPNVNRRRTPRSHPGIGVPEHGQVGLAVPVKIADVNPVLIVDAVFEHNPPHAFFAWTKTFSSKPIS
jgi:hypothetical protein